MSSSGEWQPPVIPPQWQQDAPLRKDGTFGTPQYPAQPPDQPYGYGSQYPPAGPPPRRPSWVFRHKKLTWLLAACAVAVAIGVAAAPSAPPAPAAVPAVAQPKAPAPAAVKAATVAEFSGSGTENTPAFTVSSTWKLNWSFDCSSWGQSGNFIVAEDGSIASAMNVDELAFVKSGSSYAHGDAGKHYLSVASECSWRVTVIDES